MGPLHSSSYVPAALRVPSRHFTYRFLLSVCLFALILLSLLMQNGQVGIFILLCIQVAFCADVFLWIACRDCWKGKLTFATLATVGVGAGFIYCALNTLRVTPLFGPVPDLFVYTSFLLTLSLWAQRRLLALYERAQVFIKKLDDFLPKSGRLCEGKTQRRVFARELKKGDRVFVKPGERLPCDGIIRAGSSAIDEQLITGNMRPTVKSEGSAVYAGTLNKKSGILIEVTAPLARCAIMGVLDAIKHSELRHSYVPAELDRFAGWVLGVLWLAAGGSYAYVLLHHPGGDWFYYTGVVWVILCLGCPAALVFAAVFPGFAARRGAARLKLKLNRLDALSVFGQADTFFLDKTGTLTYGELRINGIFPLQHKKQDDLIQALVTAEQKVDGSFARAVQMYAQEHGVEPKPVSSFDVLPGLGVAAQTRQGRILAGRPSWLVEQGVALPDINTGEETVIFVARNGFYLGYVALADELRAGAREVVAFLKNQGKEVILMSGDNEACVGAIARQIGLDKMNFNVLPKTKAQIITNLQALGRKVVMVGDGFNDIIALLKADAGVVLSSSKNVYNHWVDIALCGRDLFAFMDLFTINKKLHRMIVCNAVAAVLIQGLFVVLLFVWPRQLSGWHQVLGVSLGVVLLLFFNSMRLLKIK